MTRLAVVAVALLALAACDGVLDIHDHAVAPDAGADGSASSSGASSSGGTAGCTPCVMGTAVLDQCCVQ